MTLKQIVDAAKFWLGQVSEKPGVDPKDEQTERLCECANAAIEEIAAEYIPLVDTARAEAKYGKFPLSDLPRRAVAVRQVKKDGKAVAFRCLRTHCEVAENGKLDVEYVYAPRRAEWDDECEVAPSVAVKTVAFGALAEYCAIEGIPDLAEDFGDRFRRDMRASARVRREVRVPRRMWL